MILRTLVLLLFYLVLLVACCPTPEDSRCDISGISYIDVVNPEIGLKRRGLDTLEILWNDSLAFSILLQKINCEKLSFSKFSLVPMSYATSCGPHYFSDEYNSPIQFINVFSSHNYDSTHLAGSLLNDLFTFPTFPIKRSFECTECVRNGLQIVLRAPPTAIVHQRFRIVIGLENGEQFVMDSGPIIFT